MTKLQMATRMMPTAALLLGGLCRPAVGAGINQLRQEVGELEQQSRTLSVRHGTGQVTSQEQMAEHRLVDAQVLYNLEDYTRAAIILLDYVNKYQSSRGYPEAVFYLADSLYHKRDFLSAQRYFQLIVDKVRGKYYQDALQRLIELSLRTGDSSRVAEYLAALRNIPPHELKPSVPYVRGKYYYFKGRTDDAIAAFRAIPAGQKYYMHAQYFIGAALVRNKDFAGAAKIFQSLLKVEPKTKSDKHIRQLTHLALGRLLYEKNKISEAIDQYQKVDRRSKEFDTALYEICWAYVKAGEFKRALRALDLLVLANPDSPNIPEVKVLQGNLLIRLTQWGRATELFTETRDKFVPVHQRMEQLLAEHQDPNAFFDVLLARNLGDLAVTIQVPDIAVHWVKESPKVRRAMHLVKDIRDIRGSIEEARQLIERLQRAINSPAKIKIFPEFAAARADSLEIENRLAVARKDILARERALVSPMASGGEREQLLLLAQQRGELEQLIAALPTSAEGFTKRSRNEIGRLDLLHKRVSQLGVVVQNMRAQLVAAEKYFADTASVKDTGTRESFKKEAGGVRAMIDGLQQELDGLRQLIAEAKDSSGVGGPREVAERSAKDQYREVVQKEHALLLSLRQRLGPGRTTGEFDTLAELMQRLVAVEQTVRDFNARLEREVEQKLSTVRTVLAEETSQVAKYETEAVTYGGQTDQVAGGVTYLGFQDVAKRFYEIIVRADVGIIDVAWALKDQKTKEVSRLVQQQKLDLKLLDEEFREVLAED